MYSMKVVTLCALTLIWSVLLCMDYSQAFAAGVTLSQSSDIDALKQQFLPAEYHNTNFTLDDMKKIFREKCKKSGGVKNETVFKEIETGVSKMMHCLSGFTNLTAIQEEINKARPMGELDSVFHKYCDKIPVAKKCVIEFNQKLQLCFSPAEKKQNDIMMRVGMNLLNFMCTKGGDQIALFVAEEGPECFSANKEAITHCMNSSFAQYLPKGNNTKPLDLYNLPELILSPEHCIDIHRFEACTLHHLEQCQEITPANVAESVFKFIRNETSCQKHINAKANERAILKDPKSMANSMQSMSAITMFTFVAFLSMKLFRFD